MACCVKDQTALLLLMASVFWIRKCGTASQHGFWPAGAIARCMRATSISAQRNRPHHVRVHAMQAILIPYQASGSIPVPSKRTTRVVHECRSRFQTIDCLPEAWLDAWLCKERGESVTRDRLVCQAPSNIFTAVFCQWIPCRSTSKRKLVSTGTKLSRFEAEDGGRG